MQVDCVIDENSDNRRRNTLKRKLDSLEDDRELLIRLVETLRDSGDTGDTRISALLNLILSNASLSELKSYIDEQLRRAQSPELAKAHDEISRLEEASSRTHRSVLYVKRLCDQPVFRVPAKPWTTVTGDDGLVSHIISLYFTWYNPCFPWMDRDVFIRKMREGDLESQFCSPFLVNAILAAGCVSW